MSKGKFAEFAIQKDERCTLGETGGSGDILPVAKVLNRPYGCLWASSLEEGKLGIWHPLA